MQVHAHRGRGAADRAQVGRLDARRGERARPGGVGGREPRSTDEVVRRVLGIADREAFFALAGAIVERDPAAALARAPRRRSPRDLDPRDLAEGLSEHIRHLLILKVDPDGRGPGRGRAARS